MSNDKLEVMEPGEFELRKVFEETTTKNVKTIGDYTTQTRDLFRELQLEVGQLKNMLVTREAEVVALRLQLSKIQGQLYTNSA